MSGRAYQLLHSDAFSAELEALGLDSSIFGAVGIPAPIFKALVPRRACVFDERSNTFGTDSEPATFTRASDGLYQDEAGNYQVASANVIRANYSALGAFIGYLFEPAATNRCTNYNAAPDAGLTNVSASGTGEVLSRQLAVAELAAAKLSAVCPSGYVFDCDNTAGTGNMLVTVAGNSLAGQTHTLSAWCRKLIGTGSCQMQFSSGAGQVTITGDTFERYQSDNSANTSLGSAQFVVAAGARIQFILNQLETSLSESSPIITLGASASRAVDALSWPLIPSSLVDSEGMVIFDFTYTGDHWATFPSTSDFIADGAAGRWIGIVKPGTGNGRFFMRQEPTGQCQADIVGGIVNGTRYRALFRWNAAAAEIQGSVYDGSAWNDGVTSVYNGDIVDETQALVMMANLFFPFHLANVQIFNRDLGFAEAKRLFTPS